MWRLTIQGPALRLEVYLTAGQTYRVGRAHDNQIVVVDPTVSRYHATLRVLTDRVVLRDLDSKNGTFVDGHRIQDEVEVSGVEDIRLGRVILLLDRVPTSAMAQMDSMTTPSAQDLDAPCQEVLHGFQADRQLAEDLYTEWQVSVREDPERAVRKILQVCIQRGFIHRVTILRQTLAGTPTILLDTDLAPPPADLQEWALQRAAAAPRIQWRLTEAPCGVLAIPLTSHSVALLWTETTRLRNPTFRSLLWVIFWIVRWWDAHAGVRRPSSLHWAAWAPFPFWGFSGPVYRLIRRAVAVAPLSAPVAIVGPPGSGKTTLARWLHELSRPRDALRICYMDRSDDPYRMSFQEPEGPTPLLWWPLHQGTVVLRNVHECPPDVQDRLADWLMNPRITLEGIEQRLDIRWILISPDDLHRVGTGRRPLVDRLIDVFSQHVLTVPALAERREDIPYLAHYLVQQISQGRWLGVSESALVRMLAYPWPGNVRELRHVLERALQAAQTGDGPRVPFLQESHVAPFLTQ
ncbi:MAG: FHA domain-containing protein [Acidobacteria bacterium]|nr:FHA domain-containing protein [Acidobacteriota bacterium]MDW7983244.1 FHA domain-containing protein [Acidobacteriota bacterium]